MGDNLYGLSQIVATAFFVDDTFIDTSGGDVVGLGCLYAQKTLVVSQIEVGFVSVYGHIAFSVFIRIQCPRVDVDVRVKLLDGNLITSCLQQLTDGGRNDAFA